MKHPIFIITLLCGVLLTTGVSIAYYNTKTFGFDEDAALVTFSDDGVKVLDYYVDYEKAKQVVHKASEYIPNETFCCKYNDINI